MYIDGKQVMGDKKGVESDKKSGKTGFDIHCTATVSVDNETVKKLQEIVKETPEQKLDREKSVFLLTYFRENYSEPSEDGGRVFDAGSFAHNVGSVLAWCIKPCSEDEEDREKNLEVVFDEMRKSFRNTVLTTKDGNVIL